MRNKGLHQSLPATDHTKEQNKRMYEILNFNDRQDYEDANKNLIAPLGFKYLKNENGEVVWDTEVVKFLDGDSPDTVNPSLWRNSQLQAISGLFKVVDGVYQVRGISIATTVIIEGKEGIIVCDTLKSIESAKAALELYYKERPKKPVTAIIISQSHVDHFGGVEGMLEYAVHPEIPIIVPEHFTEEVISENVLLGSIMKRRSQYQFGSGLPAGEKGMVSVGIGTIVTHGTTGFHLPTLEITEKVQKLTIDDVNLKFLLTPETEAPAEMHVYVENYNVLYTSENANKTMHQIYTLRGAKARDALKWANALDDTITLIRDQKLDALVMAHAWPVWGKENAIEHLQLQRDLYKFMHDQTVRLMNHGYTMNEIAEMIELPKQLNQYFGNRGYYGTLKHNVKGIYNYYLGFYSGHPSDLDPLPETESGEKYIEYMGGVNNVLEKAKDDFKKGNYRWVAQVIKHVVMADKDNEEAKEILADTYEQLGYQAESANWRNIYLLGASELRSGIDKNESPYNSVKVFNNIPVAEFLKYLAIKLNADKVRNVKMTVHLLITDTNEKYQLNIDNSVLNFRANFSDKADITLEIERLTFYQLVDNAIDLEQVMNNEQLKLDGEIKQLKMFLNFFDQFNPLVNVVIPNGK